MNSKIHTSFSIDSLTGVNLQKNSNGNYQADTEGMHNGEIYRRTPSPSDSGMESDPSPSRPKSIGNEDSVAKVLLSLEKTFLPPKLNEVKDETDDKPTHSYIALISMAILSSPDRRMLLSDIYQYVMETFSYYNNNEKAWRNSIRHNLSLNECFVKAGRADNGKGNYWAIHPACVDDFANGDFRRRQARRRARRSLKETSQQYTQSSSSLRYNMGYVPMTASHLAYHPFDTPSLYYPQATPLVQKTQQQSQSQNSSPYYQACAMNGSQTASEATVRSVTAQKLFREQSNTAAMKMQAFAAQQQLANSLPFPNCNW